MLLKSYKQIKKGKTSPLIAAVVLETIKKLQSGYRANGGAQSQELAEAQRLIEALVQPAHDDLSVQRAQSRTPRSMMWAFHLIKKAFLCIHDGLLHPATYAVAVDMLAKVQTWRCQIHHTMCLSEKESKKMQTLFDSIATWIESCPPLTRD
jgi:hypothetical protein